MGGGGAGPMGLPGLPAPLMLPGMAIPPLASGAGASADGPWIASSANPGAVLHAGITSGSLLEVATYSGPT